MTRNAEYRELRLLVLLLALAVGLLIAAAVVCLAVVHPRLAEPLAVGTAVLTCLLGLGGLAVQAVVDRR